MNGLTPEDIAALEREPTITAGEIRDAILAANPDEIVYCHQTGGGTATMYVGEFHRDGHARIAIGPGQYNWADEWQSTFWLTPDTTAVGPDDDGTATPAYPTTLAGILEAIAAVPLRIGFEIDDPEETAQLDADLALRHAAYHGGDR